MCRPVGVAAVGVSLVISVVAHGQSSPAADQIRQRVAEFDRGGATRSALVMKDAVVWTGASSRPLTKDGDRPDLVAPNRRNDVFKTTVERIEVSQSADMAYEYGTFSLAYDDDRGTHGSQRRAPARVEEGWEHVEDCRAVSAAIRRRPPITVARSLIPKRLQGG